LMNTVILDCDTGEDDALAILVALANKMPMHYIVTSFGNTSIRNTTRNTARILSLAGAEQVLVIQGSAHAMMEHPLEKEGASAKDFVGKNGICNTYLPPSKYNNAVRLPDEGFVVKLSEIIRREATVDYIITGPCTNFAKVCHYLGESVREYVENLYIMGGAIYQDGNTGPVNPKTGNSFAEFNFYCDPYAVNKILQSGLNVHLVTWDVTSTLTIPYLQVQAFRSGTKIGEFSIRLMKNFFKYYGLGHDRNFELNDPLTVLAYLGYGHYKQEKIRVITDGEQFGRSVSDSNGYAINYFFLDDHEKEITIKKILSDLTIS
jgi:inosine-uridine nucleoside N-ribohydrolase